MIEAGDRTSETTRESMTIKGTLRTIVETLNERTARPHPYLKRIIKVLGEETTLALLDEVQQIEARGGLWVPDGSRRRTPGGVFYHLVNTRLTPTQQAQVARRQPLPPRVRPSPPPPARWAERGTWLADAQAAPQEAQRVTISLVGRPIKTVEKARFALAMLKHTPRCDALPKGIPRPDAQETLYIISIGGTQWSRVKESLHHPDDIAIIEGIPMWDADYQAMTVFATRITTKLLEQAKRKPKKSTGSA